MRSVLAWVSLLLISLGVAVGVGACGSSDSNESTGTTGVGNNTGVGGQGGDLFTNTGGGLNDGLTLDPPEATITVDNGVSTPVQFTATRGGQQVFPTSWSVDFGTIAGVDGEGLVNATNAKGGEVTVTAELDGAIGKAKVFVIYKKTVNNDAIPADVQDKLRNASGADADVTWAYPYDDTVWPRGLKGPELMWNGGGAGDAYYLHFTAAYVDMEIFTYADPPSRYQLFADDWIAINESGSGTGGDVDVHAARLPTGAPTASVVIDHEWKMSKGNLRGTVYYWANNLGRIVRIKPGQDLPEDFLANAGITACTACHTVSSDGSTLVIGGDAADTVYDLINDQTVLGLASVGKQVRNWAMPAVSPDGKFVVENNAALPGPPGGSDGLWDSATGMKLAGSGLDGVLTDMPAFGPKGHKLVHVGHDAPHDLRSYDFDLATGASSNPLLLVGAGGDPTLNAICFPNVSPTLANGENEEKTYAVYHRGVFPQSLDTRFGPGDLYLASVDEPGQEWRLEAANGDNYAYAAGDRDRHVHYEPTFAPEAAGGYLWVVFTSRRTYGNRLTGASNQVKQLWVAAIDPFPKAGEDPSHPAFWVPGQDPGTLNMRGYWALDPCIQNGNACITDTDCCDGSSCDNGICGGEETCEEIDGFCNGAGDCCHPEAQCIAQICSLQVPQ
jgi:hypothetical protein